MARGAILLVALIALVAGARSIASGGEKPVARTYAVTPPAPPSQSAADADTKSAGCRGCHSASDAASMHKSQAVVLGCTDCHGGNAAIRVAGAPGSAAYNTARNAAHVLPRYPAAWHYPSSANPERSYALINREAPEFIRFVNPSDYRVARQACGACHLETIEAAERSLMATGAMFWGGASYNNGVAPYKNYIFGSAYTKAGEPAKLLSPGTPPGTVTPSQKARGALPYLYPLPAWEVTPPGDIFRVFERGGRVIGSQFAEIGLPNPSGSIQRLDEPGRPDIRQSNRGPGTGLRVAIAVLNVHKTRLNDPFATMMGTNDQPGDYRQSGCAACHVVYANDRDPKHSLTWASAGRDGQTRTVDPVIAGLSQRMPVGHSAVGGRERGHPVEHAFTRAVPTAQCMTCHMHHPNVFLNSYLGMTMWDYESDASLMWPKEQKYPTAKQVREINERNPEAAAARGNWGDRDFLRRVVDDVNPQAKDTQFADYHGHGWNFRAVYKRDRQGNLLDKDGAIVWPDDPEKFRKKDQVGPFAKVGEQAGKAVHLMDIHAEKGMQCADCHFAQDSHGNGLIYGEVANAVEIGCVDCHGTADAWPTLKTSGPAARPGGTDLSLLRNADGQRRFEWSNDERGERVLIQRSIVDPKLEWKVSLVRETVDRDSSHFNVKAARAKLMAASAAETGKFLFGPGVALGDRAHQNDKMTCFTCHLSWTTACGGCHLPIEANWKTKTHHYEEEETRNFATYNPQVARDDMFQLGRHMTTKGAIIAPVRSSSALILSSTNLNRERIYIQQPPISSIGFSSQAFAPHFPHTVRTTETKTCTDCHLSAANDNNAIMAQLMLTGTNFVNFVGAYAWVGLDDAIQAIRVTEWSEPQTVMGSYLHRYAYPDYWRDFVEKQGRELKDRVRGQILDKHLSGERNPTELFRNPSQGTGGAARCVQLRGEYLYVAEGKGGFRVYDVASVANKGVSRAIVSAPVSPLGQDAHVASTDATCMALPTGQPIAPLRNTPAMRAANQEQAFAPIYHYAVVTDAAEGLILVNVDTLADGEPRNNFLKRALTWNPDGALTGARHVTLAGSVAYVATDRSIVVVDLADPLRPRITAKLAASDPRATALQFRYLWVTTARGLELFDATDLYHPVAVPGATVPLADARRVYVARTYAYVAAGADGLVIVDVTNPEAPKLYQKVTFDGAMNDAQDVIVASTNASLFAYVADGRNGMKVVQLTSPSTQPNFYGFSPAPKPELIAWAKTAAPALALSKGLDRDRAVDETGGQIAVFGRLGARPFTRPEMLRFYLNTRGKPWMVTDRADLNDWVALRR